MPSKEDYLKKYLEPEKKKKKKKVLFFSFELNFVDFLSFFTGTVLKF